MREKVRVSVCVCVRERERERERASVCVCVYEREIDLIIQDDERSGSAILHQPVECLHILVHHLNRDQTVRFNSLVFHHKWLDSSEHQSKLRTRKRRFDSTLRAGANEITILHQPVRCLHILVHHLDRDQIVRFN